MWLPSRVFHSCTVLSLLPEATRLPSGDKTTALTAEERFAEISTSRPVAASQTRTVLSELAEATRRLSGDQATALARALWRRYSRLLRLGESKLVKIFCLLSLAGA